MILEQGTANISSGGSWDIFVLKLNASGNFVWAKQLGGTAQDRGESIVVDVYGNVYTTGWFEGTADFNPGSGTYNLTSAGNLDFFYFKIRCLW